MPTPARKDAPPPPPRRWLSWPRVYWVTWWSGTALIAASWIDLVPRRVGWVGFALAGGATLVSVLVNRGWRPPE